MPYLPQLQYWPDFLSVPFDPLLFILQGRRQSPIQAFKSSPQSGPPTLPAPSASWISPASGGFRKCWMVFSSYRLMGCRLTDSRLDTLQCNGNMSLLFDPDSSPILSPPTSPGIFPLHFDGLPALHRCHPGNRAASSGGRGPRLRKPQMRPHPLPTPFPR